MSSEWMSVNLNKAGMDRVPKERVNAIVHELSKDSDFFKKEHKQEEIYKAKAEEVKSAIQRATAEETARNTAAMERFLAEVNLPLIWDRAGGWLGIWF